MDSSKPTSNRKVLLVYYDRVAARHLESALRNQHREVYFIDGRSPSASDQIRMHKARFVVMDRGASDINVTQAIRQIGQIAPHSLIVAVRPNHQLVNLYRGGRLVGTADSLDAFLCKDGCV